MKSKHKFSTCILCADMIQICHFNAWLIMKHVLQSRCLYFMCVLKQAESLGTGPSTTICFCMHDLKCPCLESSLCQNEVEISTAIFIEKQNEAKTQLPQPNCLFLFDQFEGLLFSLIQVFSVHAQQRHNLISKVYLPKESLDVGRSQGLNFY